MANIIINDLPSRVAYTVAAVPQSAFTAPFPFFDDGDLVVLKTVSGVTETLTLGTHYTVSGAGSITGQPPEQLHSDFPPAMPPG